MSVLIDGAAFDVFERGSWSALVQTPDGVTAAGLTDQTVTSEELRAVYWPLAQLVILASASRVTDMGLLDPTDDVPMERPPFILGISGSVASGKSVVARVLHQLLMVDQHHPRVDAFSTDGFLYPNTVLNDRGLLLRKGFPETYDYQLLVTTLQAIRSGVPVVSVPIYSHEAYDVVNGDEQRIERPDILIIEGLNVLQDSPVEPDPGAPSVYDCLDGAVYVHASEADLERWHRERLLALRVASDVPPTPFLEWFQSLSDEEARDVASQTWSEINLVNLRCHVAPTRHRAQVILENDADHRVSRVLLHGG